MKKVRETPTAIITFNLQGVITSWDNGAEQIYGYAEDEALRKYWLLLIPQEKYNEISDMLQTVKTGGSIKQQETVRMKKDGTRIAVLITIYPLRDAKQHITGITAITTKL